MTPQSLLEFFLVVPAQTRILHWQTTSFARHKALDKFYSAFEDLADDFIETYFGTYSRIEFDGILSLRLASEKTIDINGWLDSINKFLLVELPTLVQDPHLLALRDEVLKETFQLRYLLTMV